MPNFLIFSQHQTLFFFICLRWWWGCLAFLSRNCKTRSSEDSSNQILIFNSSIFSEWPDLSLHGDSLILDFFCLSCRILILDMCNNYSLIVEEFRKPSKSITISSCRYWGLGLLSPFSCPWQSSIPKAPLFSSWLKFSYFHLPHGFLLILNLINWTTSCLFHLFSCWKRIISSIKNEIFQLYSVSLLYQFTDCSCILLPSFSYLIILISIYANLFYSVKQRENTLPLIYLLYLPPVLITKTHRPFLCPYYFRFPPFPFLFFSSH